MSLFTETSRKKNSGSPVQLQCTSRKQRRLLVVQEKRELCILLLLANFFNEYRSVRMIIHTGQLDVETALYDL